MKYLGDFLDNATVRGSFNTRSSTGAPITLAGTPALSVYKDGNVAETTTGVTLTVDFDSRTGHHLFAIATTDAFYATGSDFRVVITTGTVDGVSVVGVEVGTFSIQNRSALITLGTNAPTDWINAAAIASNAITDAKVASDVTIASVTGSVGSVSGAVGSVTGNVGGNVVGSVGSVSSYGTLVADIATAVWGAGARSLTTFGTLVSDIWASATRTLTTASDSSGVTTLLSRIVGTLAAGTHNPQSGDSFARLGAPTGASIAADLADIPTVAEFNARSIPSADYFVVGDYTAPPTVGAIADAVWLEPIADHSGEGGTTAEALVGAGDIGDPWTTSLPGTYTGTQAGKILSDILVDTGTTLQAELDGIQADTEDIQSRLPAALVSGRIDASVGAMAANVLTEAAIANDAITDAKVAADVMNAISATIASDIENGNNSWDSAAPALASYNQKPSFTSAGYVGDIAEDSTVRLMFCTFFGGGLSPLSTGVVRCYKDGSNVELSGGITLTADYDSRTGMNYVSIDTSHADYSPGNYTVVITSGSVDATPVNGWVIGSFSIQSRVVSNVTNPVSLTQAFPSNFAALGINASGHVSRVTLVDTTTTNIDMRGTDGANTTAPLDAAGTRAAIGLASANLDTQLSTIDTVVDGVKAKTDQFVFTVANQVDANALSGGGSGLDAAGVRAAIGLASANLDTQLSTIDTVVDSILVDTAEIGAAGVGLTALASASNLATVAGYLDTEIAAILADTNELQTDLVNGGRIDLLIDAIKAKTDNLPADPADQSAVESAITSATGSLATSAQVVAIQGATFNTATDSLEAIRNRGDTAWVTATGFSTLDAAGVRSAIGLASANLDNQLADLPTVAEFNARSIPSADYFVAGDYTVPPAANTVASAVRTELTAELSRIDVATSTRLATAGYTAPPAAGDIADAVWDEALAGHSAAGTAGLALSTASSGGVDPSVIADAIWDEAVSSHVIAGSAGQLLTSIRDTGTTLQTELDGIQADTEDIQSRLPAALVSGRIDASVGAMASNVVTASALAADAIEEIQSGLATSSALSTIAGYLDTEIAAILEDTGTTIPAQISASLSQVVEAVWTELTVTYSGEVGSMAELMTIISNDANAAKLAAELAASAAQN